MTFFEAVALGLVEGITEFLPISSTAHLMMFARVLGLENSDFLKSFDIVIQFGAIVAVIVLFGPLFITHRNLWKKILIAFLPTAVIGFLLYQFIKVYLLGNLAIAAWSLAIGGAILIIVERFLVKKANTPKTTLENISNKQAFIIGVCQSVAIIPGVSRSAATIIPALLLGTSRVAAAEFSFLLAVPTIAAASGYELVKNVNVISGNTFILFVGFITSLIASLISIKLFISFVQKFSFTAFGVYRIIVAVLFIFLFL